MVSGSQARKLPDSAENVVVRDVRRVAASCGLIRVENPRK